MSAIWGIVRLNKSAVIPENAYDKMKHAYEERCKIDRYSMISFEDGFFACGIQHVTPQAYNENLPCDNGNGLYFTSDCMVDNPHGDTPDGKYLYEKYLEKGPDSLKEIYGAYSVAVWDSTRHALQLCADPAASRCLYYYQRDGLIVFSTLIEPIRKIFPDIPINENYIKDFLIAPMLLPNLVPRESAYLGVNKVIHGYYITFSEGKAEETKYFDPQIYNKDMKVKTIKQTDRTFRSLYEKCVGDLLRNEITGVAMSSGLDSSSIAVLAADHIKKTGHGRLLAYTYVPAMDVPSSPDNITDETKAVKEIVKSNPNIEPHFLNNHGKNCVTQIPDVVSLTEMPIKAVVNFPNLLEIYDTAAQNGCRIVMNGQFGNSTVSYGENENILYNKYVKHHYISMILDVIHTAKKLQVPFFPPLKSLFSDFKEQKQYLKHPTMMWEANYYNHYLNPKIGENYPSKERFTQSGFIYDRNIYADEDHYRANMINHPSFAYLGEIETKIGLRYGIIIRDPTRDTRFLSMFLKLPYNFFVYHGTPRCLIRRNLRDLIPLSILDDLRRYGEQNADWLLRLDRDKSGIIAFIKSHLSSGDLKDFFITNDILKTIDAWENDVIPPEDDLCCILYILSVLCFLESQ
jgi:asparagine synthase (glutamine-hydrolysing)